MRIKKLWRMTLVVTFISLLAIVVIGLGSQAAEYRIEITRAGYLTLGADFEYERGLSYSYSLQFPPKPWNRTLWILIDLNGDKSWRRSEARANVTGWTVRTRIRSEEGMSVGQYTLRISVFDERGATSPPGYRSGPVSVPPGWRARATDSVTFVVHAPEIPEHRTDGIWISSTPLGGEVYLAPRSAALRTDGTVSLAKILKDEYYRGASPVFVQVPPGDYVIGVMIPAEEELRLMRDDSFAQVVRRRRGEVVAIGRGYEVTKEPGELATVIALFQLRGRPLDEAFLYLPESAIYDFDGAAMRRSLLGRGFSVAVTDTMISLLHRTGKIAVETVSKRTIVEITARGWRVIVYSVTD